jgi:hypothetical protein
MSGPLGLRIFLMVDVFMRLSRRMRLKPGSAAGWGGEHQMKGSARQVRRIQAPLG